MTVDPKAVLAVDFVVILKKKEKSYSTVPCLFSTFFLATSVHWPLYWRELVTIVGVLRRVLQTTFRIVLALPGWKVFFRECLPGCRVMFGNIWSAFKRRQKLLEVIW